MCVQCLWRQNKTHNLTFWPPRPCWYFECRSFYKQFTSKMYVECKYKNLSLTKSSLVIFFSFNRWMCFIFITTQPPIGTRNISHGFDFLCRLRRLDRLQITQQIFLTLNYGIFDHKIFYNKGKIQIAHIKNVSFFQHTHLCTEIFI